MTDFLLESPIPQLALPAVSSSLSPVAISQPSPTAISVPASDCP